MLNVSYGHVWIKILNNLHMRLCANMCGLVCQLIWKFKSQQISSNTSTIVFTNLESTTCSILNILTQNILPDVKAPHLLIWGKRCIRKWRILQHYVYMTGLNIMCTWLDWVSKETKVVWSLNTDVWNNKLGFILHIHYVSLWLHY